MKRYYKVAGHTFAVSGNAEIFKQMGNYHLFGHSHGGYACNIE